MTNKASNQNAVESQLATKLSELQALAAQLPDENKKEIALARLNELAAHEELKAFDPGVGTSKALDCLTPSQLEDSQLVSIVKSIGRPPPFEAGVSRPQFTAFHKAWVCAFLYSIPSPQMAASIMQCSASSFYYHREQDKQFREEYDKAITAGMQMIIGAAAENALGIGDPEIMSRRSEKLLGAFLLRESRQKIDVEVEHKGGVIVIPQPLSVEEFEKVVYDQQKQHREQYPDSLGDARRQRVIIDHDTGPTPPKSNAQERQSQGGVVTLQSDSERETAIATGNAMDRIDQERSQPNRIVRSY